MRSWRCGCGSSTGKWRPADQPADKFLQSLTRRPAPCSRTPPGRRSTTWPTSCGLSTCCGRRRTATSDAASNRMRPPRMANIVLDPDKLEEKGPHGVMLDPDELTIRLVERAIGEKRPPGKTATELMDGYDDETILEYSRASCVAVLYLAQLRGEIENAQRQQKECAARDAKMAVWPPAPPAKPPSGLHWCPKRVRQNERKQAHHYAHRCRASCKANREQLPRLVPDPHASTVRFRFHVVELQFLNCAGRLEQWRLCGLLGRRRIGGHRVLPAL